MTLRSRIIPTDYSNGRFLLNMTPGSVNLYSVAVPSGYEYASYWFINGNITNLVFHATVAGFHDSDKTCWKKKMPLLNGRMGESVQRTVFIKVPKNNSSQWELLDSSKWKKDKKYWILGISLFLGSFVFVNLFLISVLLFGTYCTITRKRVPSLQSASNLGLPLKTFTYAELEDATNGFQEVLAKVDVYSFGVILLELVYCRWNVELEVAEEDQKILAYWAMNCYRGGRVDFLVDGDDEAMLNLETVERFVEVALWCLQEDPTIRPTMLKVTQMLDGATEIPTPADPSFVSSHP
ncbi:hypothetical protein EJB05_40490, partial [Eragrostis curvula]